MFVLLEVAVNLTKREYRPGDEAQLIALWNRLHASYGGFITRTAEQWCWSILQRPEVRESDILIVEWRAQIVGYAVLSQRGRVLEFVVDNAPHWWRRRRILLDLLQILEERARERGYDLLEFATAGRGDRFIDKALRNAGYSVEQGAYFSLGVLNTGELIRRLLANHAHRLPTEWRRNFLLEVSAGGYRTVRQPQVRIGVDQRTFSVCDAPAPHDSSDCQVRTDLETLTELIFGVTGFGQATAAGRVVVRDSASSKDVEMLFSALTIRAPWYTPLADAY
jgi:hypothetical protein